MRFRVSIAIGGILLLLGAAATAPATTTTRSPTRVTIVAPRLAQPGEIVRVDGTVIGRLRGVEEFDSRARSSPGLRGGLDDPQEDHPDPRESLQNMDSLLQARRIPCFRLLSQETARTTCPAARASRSGDLRSRAPSTPRSTLRELRLPRVVPGSMPAAAAPRFAPGLRPGLPGRGSRVVTAQQPEKPGEDGPDWVISGRGDRETHYERVPVPYRRKARRSGPSLLFRSRVLLHGWLIKQKQNSSTPPEPSPGARKCSLSTIWLCPPTKGL